MIIQIKAKQSVDVEIDSLHILSDIATKIILEKLIVLGITPDKRYELGSLITIRKDGTGCVGTKVSEDGYEDNLSAELPEEIVKIWKAYITLNHAIYSFELGM